MANEFYLAGEKFARVYKGRGVMHDSIIQRRNQYAVDGRFATLTVVRRDGSEHVARFNAERLGDVKRHVWRVKAGHRGQLCVYTGDSRYGGEFSLSHLIAGEPQGDDVVFHVDGDPQNYTSENLRHGSRSALKYNTNRRRGR